MKRRIITTTPPNPRVNPLLSGASIVSFSQAVALLVMLALQDAPAGTTQAGRSPQETSTTNTPPATQQATALSSASQSISSPKESVATNNNPYIGLRDPFWPIGYIPGAKKAPTNRAVKSTRPVVSPPRWKEAARHLQIKGVMKAGRDRFVAMINDQVVREGDKVSIVFGDKRYFWEVRSISSADVKFRPLKAVPLAPGQKAPPPPKPPASPVQRPEPFST